MDDSQFTVYGSQFAVYGSRFAVHGSRFAVHDSRFAAHDLRFAVHDSQLTVHDLQSTVHDSQRERWREGGRNEGRERQIETERGGHRHRGDKEGEGELGAREI